MKTSTQIAMAVVLSSLLVVGLFAPLTKDAQGASSSVYRVLTARVKSSAPSYTDGTADEINMNATGNMRVTMDDAYGTAGTANANVITVQGKASMTPVIIKGNDAAGSPTASTGLAVQGFGTTGTPANVNIAEKSDALNCYVTTTATTSTQITGCEVSTGKSIYITTACVSGDIANATATPFTLQSGTSTACSGPHVIWSGWHPALTNYCVNFPTPIKVTVSEGLCILDGVTGSKSALVSGFVK